jgi:hypothetical protein
MTYSVSLVISSEAVLVVSEAVEAEVFVAKGSNLRIKVKLTLEEPMVLRKK